MTKAKGSRKVATHKVSWNEFQHARAMRRKQGFFLTADFHTVCGADGYMVAGTWGATDCARCLAQRKKARK